MDARVGSAILLAAGATLAVGADILTVDDGTTTRLAITQTGSTRVVALDPGSALQVTQSGGGNILRLLDDATQVFVVADGGNVGVGVAGAPTARLDVLGTLRVADGTQGPNKVLVSDATGLASWQNSVGTVINASQTLNVPATFADIQAAVDSLAGKTIARGATVTIQVADGTYNNYPTIIFDHPDGERIRILGNAGDPTQVTINFTSTGLSLDRGGAIQGFNGFRMVGPGSGTSANGLQAQRCSTITAGPDLIITNFGSGAFAFHCSSIFVSSVTSTANALGFFARGNAAIYAAGATSTNNTTFGFHATNGGFVEATSATVSGNPTNFSPDGEGNSNAFILR